MLRETLGLDSVTSTERADGCGLMALWHAFLTGLQVSQTIIKEMNTVLQTTIIQLRSGMTGHALLVVPLFV